MSGFVTIITQDGTRITTPRRNSDAGSITRDGTHITTPRRTAHAGSSAQAADTRSRHPTIPELREGASELPAGDIPAGRGDPASCDAGSRPSLGGSSPTAGASAPAFLGAGRGGEGGA